MADLKRVPHGQTSFDFHELDVYTEAEASYLEEAFDAFLLADNFLPDVFLPFRYGNVCGLSNPEDGIGGPPVDDPLVVYFGISAGMVEEKIHFSTSIRSIALDAISDDPDAPAPEVTYPKRRDALTRALRQLADELDALPLWEYAKEQRNG